MKLPRPVLLEALGVSLLAGVGLFLRYRYAFNGGMWRDEAQFLDIVGLPSVAEMLRFLVQHESHPPLYYLMMRGWLGLFPDGTSSALIPGILFGTLTILAGWLAGRTFGGMGTGLSAAALIAFNPRLIQASGMVRPYPFAAFLLLLAVVLLSRGLVQKSRSALAGFALVSSLLLYSHNWTLLPLASLGFVAVALKAGGVTPLDARTMVFVGWAIALIWAPWLPSLIQQATHAGHLRFPADPVVASPYFGLYILPGLGVAATVVLMSGLGATLWIRFRYEKARLEGESRVGATLTGWVPFIAILLAALGSYRSRLLVEHSIVMVTPLTMVFAALVLTRPAAVTRWQGPVVLGATLILTAVDGSAVTRMHRSNVDTVGRYLTSNVRETDLVLVLPPFQLVSSVKHYYSGAAPVFCYPRGAVEVPLSFNNWVATDRNEERIASADRLIIEVLRHGGTVWELSIGTLDYMEQTTDRLESQMRAVAGPPTNPVGFGTAVEEEVRVRVWRVPVNRDPGSE